MTVYSALVSIIMPAYNAGAYVREAIQSVINQTYSNWELIVINDGSLDLTEKVVLNFKDSRIKYLYQDNAGVSSARNKGLSLMQGYFFCFLDADDILPEKSLASRLNVFAHDASLSFVDGRVLVMDVELKNVKRDYLPIFKGNPFSKLVGISGDCFLGNTWMIKRQLNYVYQFRKGLTHGEDRLFFIEIADQGNYSFTDDVILLYRTGHVSAMKNLKGLESGYMNLYRIIKHEFPSVNLLDLLYLKYKITRIMVLSYLSNRDYIPAIKAFMRLCWL
ncbi:glycosyltransferase family 2 protein [Nibribacter koreensis]|uniref:Glycosyltransferase family 2 protein n=1 Tax=Nibribacter koreensis TaxID=1084519 RepID=A0ABP8FHQ4_9BACT